MENMTSDIEKNFHRVGGFANPVTKTKHEYLLSLDKLPTKSPFNGKSITDFHHDILRFMKQDADDELRQRIINKYQELYIRLMNPKYNPHYIEAMILDNIYNGNDDLKNYHKKMLLKLYLYWSKFFSAEVSFNKDVVKFFREGFASLDLNEEFKDIYLFEYPSEVTRCLEDVVAKRHTLTDEEIEYIDGIYDATSDTNKTLINKIYKDVYGVGKTIGVNNSTLKRDFEKLYEYIFEGKYEEKYHKPFTIIDLYLVTNIQVEDFSSICSLGINNKEKVVALYKWFKDSYSSMFKDGEHMQESLSLNNVVRKYSCPSGYVIKELMSDSFGEYTCINHTNEDTIKAYETLLDLNKKYGVKVDQFTFLAMLSSVVRGEEQIYYKVGRYHKPYLDKTSHIQIESSPMFTRRVKNEG